MAAVQFWNGLKSFYHFLLLYWIGVISIFKQMIRTHIKTKDFPKQKGKVAIVTGGSKGIGFETAKVLASYGVHVIIATKSIEDGKKAIENIEKADASAKVDYMPLDLGSMKSVHRFSDDFLKRDLPLHILINNAGIMYPPYQLNEEGFESQFAVNYLGHFLLTNLLLGKLKENGKMDSYSRIVNVSSSTHFVGSINFDDLNSRLFYFPYAGYAQSKLALVLFTYELQRCLSNIDAFVTVNTLHPGVVYTDIYENVHWFMQRLFSYLRSWIFMEPAEGADTVVYVALSPKLEGFGGRYFENSTETESSVLSKDKNLQLRLWKESEKLLNI